MDLRLRGFARMEARGVLYAGAWSGHGAICAQGLGMFQAQSLHARGRSFSGAVSHVVVQRMKQEIAGCQLLGRAVLLTEFPPLHNKVNMLVGTHWQMEVRST